MTQKINEGRLLRAVFALAAIVVTSIYVQQEVTACHVDALDNPEIRETNLFCRLNF
ncbi:MAG: hypothetical protein AAF988_08850 [Pseudomonadota bacterium]